MSENKETKLVEDYSRHDECFEDPPPAYSSARNSCVSSEISLFTIEPDFAPEFTNDSRDIENYCAAAEDEKFSLNPDLAARTSAFIQSFMRPKAQARLVSVGLDEKEPQHTGQFTQTRENVTPPPLDIVLMVVEESIRPFLAVAKQLSRDSHRVRIAAAASCEYLVRSQGLDFFAITYDHELPLSMHNISDAHPSDEAQARLQYLRRVQQSYYEVYHRCWRACIAPFKGDHRPFLADAIIANPMARAHIHCAERLSIPLHIMSALPQTPTKAFAHPHAWISPYDGVDQSTSNVLSYAIVEESTWNVILKPINRFRQQILGLMSISPVTAGRLMADHELPHTYFCSKVLVPRPNDWSSNHEISGYLFEQRDLSFTPRKDLECFLVSGPAPIFLMLPENSIKDIFRLALIIQDAILKKGYRVLLSRDCRRLGELLNSTNVLIIESVPLEWLLPRVAVVIHNGSPSSTQLALQYGKPSVIIATTENHLSTAHTIAKIGAGASPLMSRTLTSEGLAQAIAFGLRTDVQQSTQAIKRQVDEEAGLENAIRSFYRSLPSQVQTCGITKHDLAMYQIWNRPSLVISSEAAAVLVQESVIKITDIVLINRCIYKLQAESSVSYDGTAKEYWNGFTNAAKDIVIASDLVSMISGRQKESSTDEERKVKRSVARDVGVGTAKFFGHIALLPFTSTALVVNTVTYGVKNVKKHQAQGEKREETDIAATYDIAGDDECDAAASKNPGLSPSREGVDPTKQAWQRGSSRIGITAARTGSSATLTANQIQLKNEEHVEAICRRHLDRGFKSPKVADTAFRERVLSAFENGVM
ncbi:UDP-Glycosyltransferase/glycogen phosphorylase [Aspergillus eucalypticola CBS 122712]|uniref:UDP-Glycosyltransferase/glycogen phosphorylase n=1 Tax=Aspergillus eucalypticola (strain CBS 122712 / IBT 29274) TaxID=1448314 RepID=A0A317UVT6_ASPEC|nr:UDP-Glycosyltransferase/glycogen phosphorylase [Aspergillus eucalypticola CBS 122712]PWY64607.1 UDP-Glycosyltransferase/glycogen phosphorylase [Aspergillus eucalypticola CBS 122712]